MEKALLIGTYPSKRELAESKISFEELKRLAETAHVSVESEVFFELKSKNPATCFGKGKVAEIKQLILQENKYHVIISDESLTPTQTRNLEREWGIKVLDRTGIILDIFAARARTREGKLQVEVAQLAYLLPRLVGRGAEFSQLAGGIGTRGPGETKLELDRRKAKNRFDHLRAQLKKVSAHRELHRENRKSLPIPTVSLVGYTNAGKSTLMNRLTEANVFVEDKLFATLDPTVRRLKLPSGREILFSDTVGFISKLPHELVDAFKATFEEVESAELLLHVIDASDPHQSFLKKTVEDVLRELHLENKPSLLVYNKIDRIDSVENLSGDVFVSAKEGDGIDSLLEEIDHALADSMRLAQICLPYSEAALLNEIYSQCRVLSRKDKDEGMIFNLELNEKYFQKLKQFFC